MPTPSSPLTCGRSAQVTTFPLETMTEEQRQVFRQYLDARRETGWELHEPVWLALTDKLAPHPPVFEL